MKSPLVFLLIFAGLFTVALSAADCIKDGHEFNKGETYQPRNSCMEIKCTGIQTLIAKGCPTQKTLKPCIFIPTDHTKPYPACCPRYDC